MEPDGTETIAHVKMRIDYLERLGEELVSRGFRVSLATPAGRPPSLHVMNPDTSALAENILAEGGADGWWFWWSWAERISTADDVARAADLVAGVLASTETP
jgi:hypothetical protein